MSCKKAILFIFWVFVAGSTVFAQNKTYSKQDITNKNEFAYDVIKTNPMALFCGPTLITSELGLSYEFSVSKNRAVSIGASWLTKNVFIYLSELSYNAQNSSSQSGNVVYVQPDLKISGYRIQAHYKFLFPVFNNFPSALHVGPHASFSTTLFGDAQNQFNNDYYRIVHQNISILAGYQFSVKNKVYFDVYHGLGYKYNYMVFHKTPTQYKREDGDFIFTGIPLNLKISLGINIGILR